VALALKQFFASLHLRIAAIPNFDPRGSLAIRNIGSNAVLGYDALQVHLADALEQYSTVLFKMVGVPQRG